jgi:hypothetical protein
MGDSNQKRTTDRLAGVQYTPVISCALDHRAGKWHSVHALVTPNKPAALQEACTLRTFCAPAPLPCAGALRRAVATGIKHNTTCISPGFLFFACIPAFLLASRIAERVPLSARPPGQRCAEAMPRTNGYRICFQRIISLCEQWRQTQIESHVVRRHVHAVASWAQGRRKLVGRQVVGIQLATIHFSCMSAAPFVRLPQELINKLETSGSQVDQLVNRLNDTTSLSADKIQDLQRRVSRLGPIAALFTEYRRIHDEVLHLRCCRWCSHISHALCRPSSSWRSAGRNAVADGYKIVTTAMLPFQFIVNAGAHSVVQIQAYQDIIAEDDSNELRKHAEDEIKALEVQAGGVERDLLISLLPREQAESCDVLLEVRAGAGGQEASLFAEELFRMYKLYSGVANTMPCFSHAASRLVRPSRYQNSFHTWSTAVH